MRYQHPAFFLLLVIFQQTVLAEPHGLKLTAEEEAAILKQREAASRKNAEAKELKMPSGLDVKDINLACRKHKILDGLKFVNARAEALSNKVSGLSRNDEQSEEELKKTCIEVSNLAGVAGRLMNSLVEKKLDEDREIVRGSQLYTAAGEYGARDLNRLCEKIVATVSLRSTGELTASKNELSSLLSKMAADTRQSFNSSISENSHKR